MLLTRLCSPFAGISRWMALVVATQVFLALLYLYSAGWKASIPSSIKVIFPENAWTQVQAKENETLVQKWNGYRGMLVVAAMNDTNIAWLEEVQLRKKWLPQIYNVQHNYQGENTLTIPCNKGHEAMVYLTYIIDNYESLPPYTMFLHGHRSSWHQELDVDQALRNIRLDQVDEHGYINLRCDWYPSCPAELKLYTHDGIVWGPGVHREDAERGISSAWTELFPGVTMPETIASQCCAQFVATRQAIERHRREDYQRFRQWILKTDLIDDVSGRVFEKLWAYIMTGNPINCPSPQSCACNFFGNCQKHEWPAPPKELGPLPEDSRMA